MFAETPLLSPIINKRFGSPEAFEDFVLRRIEIWRHGIEGPAKIKSWLSISNVFAVLVISLVTYFAATFINHLAQLRQHEIDDESLRLQGVTKATEKND